MIGALLVRTAFPRFTKAVSRKDVEAVSRGVAEDAVFEFPGRSRMSGSYEGREAIRGFWARVFERYDTVTMTPKRIALTHPYALGLTNSVLMEWRLDATTEDGLQIHAEGVAAVEIRRGKMVHSRDYFFDPTVLEVIWGPREGESRRSSPSGTTRPA